MVTSIAIGDLVYHGADSPISAKIVTIVAILVLAKIMHRVSVWLLQRAWRRRSAAGAVSANMNEIQRAKRQQTIGTLLNSVAKYAVYGAALGAIIIIVSPGIASAVFGASLLVVLVGFGLRQLLTDIVAGSLLLFDGSIRVGDIVSIPAHGVAGSIEEFTLRSTKIRTFAGDRISIDNGSMPAIVRWANGRREYAIECVVAGEVEAVAPRLRELCDVTLGGMSRWWLQSPRLSQVRPVGEGTNLVRCNIYLAVAPSHEAIAEHAREVVKAQLGDDLIGGTALIPVTKTMFNMLVAAAPETENIVVQDS